MVSSATTSNTCSPHPRGWSHARRQGHGRLPLLPAPAGMVPAPRPTPRGAPAAPRTRGDGPPASLRKISGAHCSPHPRGWSLWAVAASGTTSLLPAPAGMVPRPRGTAYRAHTAPRTRGDGPVPNSADAPGIHRSPHPRGWSHGPVVRAHDDALLPAPAGMVPSRAGAGTAWWSAPRTRGDGPSSALPMLPLPHCSPHPRGWPPRPEGEVGLWLLLPAPVGMVPRPPRRG